MKKHKLRMEREEEREGEFLEGKNPKCFGIALYGEEKEKEKKRKCVGCLSYIITKRGSAEKKKT